MDALAFRPCPFCAHDRPSVAAIECDLVERVAVICPECGAVGPIATADDPPGPAEHMWNSRFGVQ